MRRSNVRTVNCDNNHEKVGKMDPVKLQFRSSRPGYKFPHKQNTKSSFVFYTSVAFVTAIVCYLLFFPNRSSDRGYAHQRYGIVIDGGSTGTRIHVFNYQVQDGILKYDFGKNGLASMKVNPGLSAYADEPEKARAAIEELLAFGRKRVPRDYWRETEIRLMATAGMRMLDDAVQEKILEACRRVLRGSGFRFYDDWAAVISGSDEGMYAWVVANYALGTLGGDPRQTTGIIELGGASAQVTFVSDEPLPPEYSRTVTYGNVSYNLYSHSLLQFGQNVAFDLLREAFFSGGQDLAANSLLSGEISDPCTPRGYTHNVGEWNTMPSSSAEKSRYLSALRPSGNFSECRSASLTLLQKDKEKCSYSNCYIGSTFIPKLQGKFLATENFFHTSKFFGLDPQAFLSDLMVAGQRFCEDDWSKLKRKYNSLEEEDLRRYCFSSAYIVALLHDSLGIALDDQRIKYANQVEDIPLDWALGAFILQSTLAIDYEHYHPSIAAVIAGDSTSLLLLFAILLVLIFTGWIFSKCRKPQLKTIYDLEKGKYIVTRVNRYS
ncbi:OLC1v1032784C1 [Oldenlandia corymbosa var. corymbosa]|uniref:OLC1v1032784C1 n=1 Tax=Oldenlandia corymbosa var. corymbosa TaxID=529605 RepID=A0AAV1CLV9_OLDCO|nr:OLC1v1032784C1 [Oldenlandia corymbosa var. corymbosa]